LFPITQKNKILSLKFLIFGYIIKSKLGFFEYISQFLFDTWNLELGTWNLELGTLIIKIKEFLFVFLI
jgi:hypothetical protein